MELWVSKETCHNGNKKNDQKEVKKMKRTITAFVICMIMLTLAACKGGNYNDNSGSGGANTPPTVVINTPNEDETFLPDSDINIRAHATDNGTVARIVILQGETVLCRNDAFTLNCTWEDVPAGHYTLVAIATDNEGATGSDTVRIFVGNAPPGTNLPPEVTITSPADGTDYPAPANFTVMVYATDPDDLVASVQFWIDDTPLGTDNTTPYSLDVTDLPAGRYVLWAEATDSRGATGISQLVVIEVGNISPLDNTPPVITIVSPANGANYQAPANFNVGAVAIDADGDAIASVDLMQGTTTLATLTAEPYVFSINNLPIGTYVFWGRATDVYGAQGISEPVTVSVTNTPLVANNPPNVLVTSPADGATYIAPANFNITAEAVDTDGDLIASVTFLINGTVLGTDNTAPYSVPVTNLPIGNYVIYARAIDARGAVGISQLISVHVGTVSPTANTPPTVVMVSPADGATYTAPTNIQVGAIASDPDGDAITHVELMQGNTLLLTDTTAPYNISITNLPAGTYVFWARAIDSRGASAISQLVRIRVYNPTPAINNPPRVIVVSPADGATYTAPASLSVTAYVTDPDGDAIGQVELLQGGTVIGTFNSAPYTVVLNNLTAGNYVFWARGTDARGATGVSQLVQIRVGNPTPAINIPPNVILTSPGDGVSYVAPANFNVGADVVDSDGDIITQVELMQGNTVLVIDTTAPYTLPITNLPVGNYTYWARATDSRGGVGVSQLVRITVVAAPPVVNNPPLVIITSPADGATYLAPANFTVTAIATDSDNDAIVSVTFMNGNTVLGTDISAPFSVPIVNLPIGNYVIYAQATDARGAVGTSQLINIFVGNVSPTINNPPIVVIVSPFDGATYTAPADFIVSAFVNDPDGDAITGVEFLMGSTVLGVDNTAPYDVSVTNLAAGNYVLWARATDNRGAVGMSQLVTIHVGSLPPSVNNDPLVILVSPANGANYVAPADFYAQALVIDPDGDAIIQVEFLVGNDVVAVDSTAPFTMPVKLRSAGLYTVWARATDSRGGIGMSEIVSVNVTQPIPNALVWCYTSPPANTMGQAASLDPNSGPDTGAWIPYRDLAVDGSGCVSIAQVDGRIPYIWVDGTYGPAADGLWFGASIPPNEIWVDGVAYTTIQFFPYVVGIGSGYFVCLTDDCGLQSGYGHILIQLFTDADKDGTPNISDNCMIYANDQLDSNGDGVGDACDGRDSDNDAYRDYDDAYPNNPLLH
ncbi:hypothetical protein JW977_01380 [Candidatus Falkowbacteria bacterium]|nr:hypothetical protein [Candidatus Falkowbacteria bacterium]